MLKTIVDARAAGLAIGAALLAAGLAGLPAMAQQTGQPGASTTGQPGAGKPAKVAKPAAAKKRAVSAPTSIETQARQWTLDDALPKGSSAASDRYATPSIERFGRVPLQQGPGTFGLDTETRNKPNEFSDGRRIPGLEGELYKSPSYFGLSVTVPTDDKRLPVPLPPLFGRPD